MIEKLEFTNDSDFIELNLYRTRDKLNEVIEYLNARESKEKDVDNLFGAFGKKLNPKWKVGDECWYVNFISGSSNKWTIELVSVNEFLLTQIKKKEGDMNIFKTREQAEAALAEIKEVLRRYQ